MTVTGNLRDVMKESISAAASYVRMRALAFGIKPPLSDNCDIHVHVPEGATPKDGPSRRRYGHCDRLCDDRHSGAPTRRHDRRNHAAWPRVADRRSQGEAARGPARRHQNSAHSRRERQGSRGNQREHQEDLEIVPVSRMDEVLARAMARKPEPIEWDETTTAAAAAPEEAPVEEEASALTAH
jgi:ATP-dependent Lon protease